MAKYLYKLKSLWHKPQEACDTFIREDSQKSCLNEPLQYDTKRCNLDWICHHGQFISIEYDIWNKPEGVLQNAELHIFLNSGC